MPPSLELNFSEKQDSGNVLGSSADEGEGEAAVSRTSMLSGSLVGFAKAENWKCPCTVGRVTCSKATRRLKPYSGCHNCKFDRVISAGCGLASRTTDQMHDVAAWLPPLSGCPIWPTQCLRTRSPCFSCTALPGRILAAFARSLEIHLKF